MAEKKKAEHWQYNKRITEIKDRIQKTKCWDSNMPITIYPEEIMTILDVLDHLTEVDER